jgi:hypothetical protein
MFKELVQPQQIQNCRLFQLIGSVIGFVRHPYDDGQEIARWDKVIKHGRFASHQNRVIAGHRWCGRGVLRGAKPE